MPATRKITTRLVHQILLNCCRRSRRRFRNTRALSLKRSNQLRRLRSRIRLQRVCMASHAELPLPALSRWTGRQSRRGCTLWVIYGTITAIHSARFFVHDFHPIQFSLSVTFLLAPSEIPPLARCHLSRTPRYNRGI